MVFRSSSTSWIRSTLIHLLGSKSTGEGFVLLNSKEPVTALRRQQGDRTQKTGQPALCSGTSSPNAILGAAHVSQSLCFFQYLAHISSGIAAAHALTCDAGSLLTWRMQAPLAAWRPPGKDQCSLCTDTPMFFQTINFGLLR